MKNKYDLHCHSLYSDGELSVSELFELAAERSISHLALTDHDTLAGLEEAKQAASENGITLINGLELSATWRWQLLHIVGLGVNPNNPILQRGVAQNQARRYARAKRMLDDFSKHGIELADQLAQILKGATPTRPHFAQALINLGYAKDKNQAFKRYLVPGKPGFVSLEWPSLQEIGEWIAAAGGVAVLAHPMRYKFSRTKLIELIEEMKTCGIHGIEVSTPINDQRQIDMLNQLAKEYNLLASMGSDFHSPDQPWAKLGFAKPLSEDLIPVWTVL